jgi:hypothetical protein
MNEKTAETFDFDAMMFNAASKSNPQATKLLEEKRLFDLARGDSPTRIMKINKP